MRLKRVILFENNKPLRYGFAVLIALLLILTVYADRIGWWRKTLGEIKADVVLECPALERGCTFYLKGKPYTVKSDVPLEVGKPFVLDLTGDAVTAKAFWRMTTMDMGANNYTLKLTADKHWQARVVLPPSPHGDEKWQLHLELNSRAADINTLIRNEFAPITHSMKK